jgi:hypothetical protein
VFFATGAGVEGNRKVLGWAREEGEFGLGAAGIFLYLFPQTMVLFELCQQCVWGVAIEHHGIVPVLSWVQKLSYEFSIQFFLLAFLCLPSILPSRQKAECQFPCILTQECSLVRYAVGKEGFQLMYVDLWGVEQCDERLYFREEIGG